MDDRINQTVDAAVAKHWRSDRALLTLLCLVGADLCPARGFLGLSESEREAATIATKKRVAAKLMEEIGHGN